MSRSRRKTPIFAMTNADSEKKDKQSANRSYRRRVKVQICKSSEVIAKIREVSDVWSFNKDGRRYHANLKDSKEMRK